MDKLDQIAQAPRQEVFANEINLASARTAVEQSISPAGAETELEGTWSAIGATVSGDAAPQIVGQRLTFQGDRFQITKDGALRYGGRFSLNSAARPPTIEFDQSETETLRGVWLGIYKMAGGGLTICDNAPDMAKPRPNSFGECAEAGYVLVHFTRQD